MDTLHISLLVCGLVLVFGAQSSFSDPSCFVCNSKYEKGCKDPFDPEDPENIANYMKSCEDEGLARNANYTKCRKIIQEVEGEHRIVRQCGSKARTDRTCIERTGTKEVKIFYCECDPEKDGDGCNQAPSLLPLNMALLTLVSGLLAFIYHS